MADKKNVAFHIVGDAFVDLFSFLEGDWPEKGGDSSLSQPIQTFAGGSSTNTTTHLNVLNSHFTDQSMDLVLHTILNPNDHYGNLLLRHAKDQGFLLINCKESDDSSATGHCVAIVAGQERSFMTYRGCVDNFQADHLDLDQIIGGPESHLHLHIAGFFNLSGFQNGQILKQILKIREQRQSYRNVETVVSLVPQHDATKLWDGGIDELATYLDFLIMNDLEAMHIMQQGKIRKKMATASDFANSIDATDTLIADCAAYFNELCPQTCVVLTRGPSGAVALLNGNVIADQSTVKVTPIDPTGAGDSFAAGFMHGLWDWRQKKGDNGNVEVVPTTDAPRTFSWPAEALQFGLLWGCAMGSSSVLVRGASIPSSKDDIQRLFTEIEKLDK